MTGKNPQSHSPTLAPPAYSPFMNSSASASLPLLVRMPDGERHQVDVAPTASVKDLKSSIANLSSSWGFPDTQQDQNWELGFGGATLNEDQTLGHYHIPDAYDHANGLLKTISDSGYEDPDKKVEALNKACAVVVGISRGEKDMERLIKAVLEDTDEPIPVSPSAQPTIATLKKSRRSRIPSLNFAALTPPTLTTSATKPDDKGPHQSAPPTPSQLIRKLSGLRPDLYDPLAAERAMASYGQIGSSSSKLGLPSLGANDLPPQAGSGELKRESTWFTELISSVGNSIPKAEKPSASITGSSEDDEDNEDDVEGDSEGEAEGAPKPSSASRHADNPGNNTNSGGLDSKHILGTSPEAEHRKARSQDDIDRKSLRGVDMRAPVETNGKSANASLGEGSGPSAHGAVKGTSSSSPIASAESQKQVIGLAPETGATEEGKIRRKRGRKPKNPHLSEEQRKKQRQAQNRESAKQSRIRRKKATIEYERRVTTLEGENKHLRDTVNALTERLEVLQNLLTISVQRRPVQQVNTPSQAGMNTMPTLGGPSLNPHPPLRGQGALSAPGALNIHTQLGPQAPYHNVSHVSAHREIGNPSRAHTGTQRISRPSAPRSNPLTHMDFTNF